MARNLLLIVVTHPDARARFNQALAWASLHLVYALDVEDGLERFEEVKPDLLLVPAAHAEALARFRAHPEADDLPVVLYGAGAAPHPEADAVVALAFESESLLAVVAPLLAYGRPEPRTPEAEDGRDLDARTVVSYPNPYAEAVDPEVTPLGDDDEAPEEPTPVSRPAAEPSSADAAAEPSSADAAAEPSSADAAAEPSSADAAAEPPGADAAAEPPHPRGPAAASARLRSQSGDRRRELADSQLGQRLAQRVRSLHAALDRADHYQLLGVAPTADETEIHAAWFDLALELHPDRFFFLRELELRSMLHDIHRRIGEAYDVLVDPAQRAAYDRAERTTSARGRPARRPSTPGARARIRLEAGNPAARTFAERAGSALAREDLQEARFHLHALLACEEDNPSARRALAEIARRLGPVV